MGFRNVFLVFCLNFLLLLYSSLLYASQYAPSGTAVPLRVPVGVPRSPGYATGIPKVPAPHAQGSAETVYGAPFVQSSSPATSFATAGFSFILRATFRALCGGHLPVQAVGWSREPRNAVQASRESSAIVRTDATSGPGSGVPSRRRGLWIPQLLSRGIRAPAHALMTYWRGTVSDLAWGASKSALFFFYGYLHRLRADSQYCSIPFVLIFSFTATQALYRPGSKCVCSQGNSSHS